MPICGYSQGLVESCLMHVVQEPFPMNLSVDEFRVVVYEVDFTGQHTPMEGLECGCLFTRIVLFA